MHKIKTSLHAFEVQPITAVLILRRFTKDFKNGNCCFTCYNAQQLKSCAENKETVSGLYVSERKIILVLAL